MQYKLKMLPFIPHVPSTFLWAMSDVHSRMIHSFESILFKGLIKPVGKPVNRFANQFEWFVQFSSFSRLKRFSLRVVTSRTLKMWLFLSTVNWKQICKGYCLLAMKIFIRWTPRVLSMVPQVAYRLDRLHSITVHDTTMTLPVCCTCTLYIK